jgi:hypothetical protein
MEIFNMENDMEQFDFNVFKEQLKIKYNNVDFEYFRQLFDYAVTLDYGTDVYVGGDEYCQTQNIDNKKEYYGYIIEMYDKLKTFESDIQKDNQVIEENTRGYTSIDYYDRGIIANIILLYRICKTYHNEIERIREKLPNSLPKINPSHFARSFSETEQKKLYEGLTNGGFLPKGTNYSHFCHVFGGMAIPDSEMPSLQWNKNKQLLRELLTHNKIKGTLSVAEIERQTPSHFIDRKGNKLYLAKNKPVGSVDSDTIIKILATL